MPAHDFFGFLRESLGLLESEAPHAYGRLLHELHGLRTCMITDGGRREYLFESGSITESDVSACADLDVAFDRGTLLDLIDGRTSLEEAISAERLWIRGGAEAVERFHTGMLIYLDGAVRSPGFPDLLARYRQPN